MPAYHVSTCFDIQGEYFVTYPGPGQFYLALEEALAALAAGRLTVALVGAVAHQTNFLVAHHYGRVRPAMPASQLRDGAGFLVLEEASAHQARGGCGRGRGQLRDFSVSYAPRDPFACELAPAESFIGMAAPPGEFGAASLPLALSGGTRGVVRHELRARDGLTARSTWEFWDPSGA
jgi:hypothetical protein